VLVGSEALTLGLWPNLPRYFAAGLKSRPFKAARSCLRSSNGFGDGGGIKRHGTTSLLATLDAKTGKIIGETPPPPLHRVPSLPRHHRKNVPGELDAPLALDSREQANALIELDQVWLLPINAVVGRDSVEA
jgi:hypothetical protein